MAKHWFRPRTGIRIGLLTLCLLLPFSVLSQISLRPAVTTNGSHHALASARSSISDDQAKSSEKEPDKGLPLKPARKLEFTTDEGTWMSVDVSPDGKTIVFDLLGNLYTMPIAGGEATRITNSGLAFNSQPRYSPDGKWIAFISDRDGADNVWVSNPDGSGAKKITDEQRSSFVTPAWTFDSEYVLVTRQTETSPNEIWMYHIKGGSGVQVSKGGTITGNPYGPDAIQPEMGAVASPDGRYLYLAKNARTGWTEETRFPFWQIARRDLITGDEDILTRDQGSGMRPQISPDGRKLVYGTRYDSQTGLRILDLVTGENRWLKYPAQRDDQEFAKTLLPGYAFTPDGKSILASYGGKIHRIDADTGEEHVIPFVAHVSQDLGPRLEFPRRVDDGPTVRARLIQNPVESPDGRQLAFSALTHLYVMDFPNGKARRVTHGNAREFQPAWSPDGQWLAYVTWSADEGGNIWKARADGEGAPQRLTSSPAFYMEVNWSKDASRIVASRVARQRSLQNPIMEVFDREVEAFDLVWIPSEGGEAKLIAPARGAARPHFTNDPDRIYVHFGQSLFSMRYDGTDRRTHLKIDGKGLVQADPSPIDILLSPNGDLALILFRTQLYLAAVPKVGGDAPTINLDSSSVPVKRLTDIGADYFAWADGGATITWALGSKFYRQKTSTVSFEPEKKKNADDAGKNETESKETSSTDQPSRKEQNPPIEEFSVTVEQPREKPSGTIVLRGAQVITMEGDQVIPDGDVVVTDNRIAGVGRRGSVRFPPGANIVDVRGATIMPGLIDVHDHWLQRTLGDVLGMENWDFMANLAYGVTTGRDPQTATNDIFAYQDLVDTGEMLGPRAFSTGPGIFGTSDFQSAGEAYNRVSKYTDYYGTHLIKSYIVGNRRQREWIVEACQKLEVMPTTEGGGDFALDLTHAIDGFSGNEHALPVATLYQDVIELFARSQISYTPTLLVAYGGPPAENYFFENYDVHDDAKVTRFIPHASFLDWITRRRNWYRQDEYDYPQIAASAAKIIGAGGKVCIGGHGELAGLGTHWEIWALSTGGISNLEALRAATISGAEAIGYAQDLGSIEVGKLADLIVLSKDPLKDIHNTNTIRYVMKNGDLYEGDTLDEVWPKKKALPAQWFWNDKP